MSGKPKKANWGGKRKGAGRPEIAKAGPIERPAYGNPATGQTPQERAKTGLELAFQTLEHIEANGATEGARVAAARIIIETAIGKPGKTVDEPVAKPVDKWGAMLDETGWMKPAH